MSIQRMLLTATLALGLLMAVGCQSTPTGSAPSAMAQRAVVITGGQAGAVTVLIPNADNSDVEVLSADGKAAVCPDCKMAIQAYFRTGAALTPKCATCGAIRTPVTLATPYVSHN